MRGQNLINQSFCVDRFWLVIPGGHRKAASSEFIASGWWL